MKSEGKIQVFVRSRRVPIRTVHFNEAVYTPTGFPMGNRTSTLVVYDDVLDEEQHRAIKEGRRLACNLGLELEVVDRSKSGLLRRLNPFGQIGTRNLKIAVSPVAEAHPKMPHGAASLN